MHVMTKANTTYVCTAKQHSYLDRPKKLTLGKYLTIACTTTPGEPDANCCYALVVSDFALPLSRDWRAWVLSRLRRRRDMGFQISMVDDDVMALCIWSMQIWWSTCRAAFKKESVYSSRIVDSLRYRTVGRRRLARTRCQQQAVADEMP